jgi:hypothetical protein
MEVSKETPLSYSRAFPIQGEKKMVAPARASAMQSSSQVSASGTIVHCGDTDLHDLDLSLHLTD